MLYANKYYDFLVSSVGDEAKGGKMVEKSNSRERARRSRIRETSRFLDFMARIVD